MFQHTAARRRLALRTAGAKSFVAVSTHSRPKAAGAFAHGATAPVRFQHTAARRRLVKFRHRMRERLRFNTQPPEGGWRCLVRATYNSMCFNTQPPEGGWLLPSNMPKIKKWFQHTAARRRLEDLKMRYNTNYCFNTQPPEGGWMWAAVALP